MVLVVNKKTKEQMDNDLSLFLGHNTEQFTSWLTGVLEQLNTAAARTSASATQASAAVAGKVSLPFLAPFVEPLQFGLKLKQLKVAYTNHYVLSFQMQVVFCIPEIDL